MSVRTLIQHAILHPIYSRFYRLEASAFSADKLQLVQGFNCGSGPRERALADWITGGDALADIANPQRQTKVWLYWCRKHLVGYGSIGLSRRRVPAPSGPHVNVSIIPCLAMQVKSHGKPWMALRHDKFSGQIMLDLIDQARLIGRPLLILYVHPKNLAAIALYKNFDFQATGYLNPDGYELMTLKL